MTLSSSKSKLIIIVIILIVMLPIAYMSIMSYKHKLAIEADHGKIKKILDLALLSDDPVQLFEQAFPQIKEYPTVDSAWVRGLTLYVKYVNGGTVSWSMSPDRLKYGQ